MPETEPPDYEYLTLVIALIQLTLDLITRISPH